MEFLQFEINNGNIISTPLQNIVETVEHNDGTVKIRYHVNYALCESYTVDKNKIKIINL